jgi:hypothetical protein
MTMSLFVLDRNVPWHLSRILCLRGSLLALETRLKDSVELVESVLDGGSDTAPASGFQWRDGETELELEGLLRLERTSMIAAHDFELAVNLTSALEVESCGASRGKLLVFSTRLP